MAFNASDFVKSSAKSASQKIVDSSISSLTRGLPTSTKSIAGAASGSLLAGGSTNQSIGDLTRNVVNTTVTGAAAEFFTQASSRISGSVASQRNTVGVNDYLLDVNPSTKIGSRKAKDEYEVFAVL